MKKFCSNLILLASLFNYASGQTRLTIIGTTHQPTVNINSASLLLTLMKIKPDVILLELDTVLMDKNGNLKGRAINSSGNEGDATKAYKQLKPNLIVRRFDIEDRSFYYDSHNTFATENKLYKSLDSMYHYKALDDASMKTMADFYNINNQQQRLEAEKLTDINTKAYRDIAARREFMLYHDLLKVLGNSPVLKKYYDFYKDDSDFWETRNKAMIKNIIEYIDTFKGKNIVVLTGSQHTYYLYGGLEPVQAQNHFKLLSVPGGN